jgi:subtilase family serine protease
VTLALQRAGRRPDIQRMLRACPSFRRVSLAVATVALMLPVGSAASLAPSAADLARVASPNLVVKRFVAPASPNVDALASMHWQPSALAAAYGLTWSPTLGKGKTIAVVDAYNSPHAASDLAWFSTHYNLPQCTLASGCFKKLNQNGQASPLPSNNAGWSLEINLDVQWVHAIAPGAKIILVEASSSSFGNFIAAEHYANQVSNAQYISNSWGAAEFSGEHSLDQYFTPKAGKAMLFAAGDDGLPAEYPSSDPNVISVGGTNLKKSGLSVVETVWSDGGGGCSAFESANSAQANFSEYAQAGCAGMRATPDLAAIADPNTGVYVYDSYPYQGKTGIWQVGGTSLASPVTAAIAADRSVGLAWSNLYGSRYAWRDANAPQPSGTTNGASQCFTGYDLCTGRGSLLGLAG